MFNASASNNFNNSYMPAPAVDENEITNRTKSKITITKRNTEDSRPAKGSKRSLCDTSNNQTLLNESEIRAEIGMSHKSTIQVPDSEDDDDDVLLTQALEKQEQALSQKQDTQTPPAKKQRSLVQSLFEEEDDGGADDDNSKSVNNASVKKISFATLCQNSQSDDSSDEDENNGTYGKTNSIYVADSDSE